MPKPGHMLETLHIAVDYFRMRTVEKANIEHLFLTHCHADHLNGLPCILLMPLYCSEISAAVLPVLFPGLDTSFVRPLGLGSHLIALSDGSDMTVTLFDANHCPGAVMFLFEHSLGKYLFTGDFRNDVEMSCVSSLSRVIVDRVYCDNTYWNTNEFASRIEVQKDIIETVEKRIGSSCILFATRKLGKEDLFCKISERFKVPFLVSKSRYDMLSAIANAKSGYNLLNSKTLSQYFTTDPVQNKLKLVDFRGCCDALYENRLKHDSILIVPSSLQHSQILPGNRRPEWMDELKKYIFVFPYSDHSSNLECRKFLKSFRMHSLVPICKEFTVEERLEFEMEKPSTSEIVPNYVQPVVFKSKSLPSINQLPVIPRSNSFGQTVKRLLWGNGTRRANKLVFESPSPPKKIEKKSDKIPTENLNPELNGRGNLVEDVLLFGSTSTTEEGDLFDVTAPESSKKVRRDLNSKEFGTKGKIVSVQSKLSSFLKSESNTEKEKSKINISNEFESISKWSIQSTKQLNNQVNKNNDTDSNYDLVQTVDEILTEYYGK